MSADNGIYVLHTNGPQWRVIEGAAIDDIYWDEDLKDDTQDLDIIAKNCREYWGSSPVFVTELAALRYATQISREQYTEYGIVFLEFDFLF